MQISMYKASMPVLMRSLANLDHILEVGAAHATASKLAENVLLGWRLAPDMFPLSRQVQIATDVAKGCPSRLCGQTPPAYQDNESSFDELRARITRTLTHLGGFSSADIDGCETRVVELKVGGQLHSFAGIDYLFDFVLPNVHFHVTTSYTILRRCGAPLGKRDFLGAT